MSCYPFFLLTTSIITVLPLDVNADSINHFESVWNDMRDALSKGRLKKSLPLSSAFTDIHATMDGKARREDQNGLRLEHILQFFASG